MQGQEIKLTPSGRHCIRPFCRQECFAELHPYICPDCLPEIRFRELAGEGDGWQRYQFEDRRVILVDETGCVRHDEIVPFNL
jgi:hypothetical protein